MTSSKLLRVVFVLSLTLGLSFLSPMSASAVSNFDNSFINEFPLKATILDDKSTTYKEFRNHLKTVEFSITNFNDYVISTSANKPALDKYKKLKFDSSHRWLFMSETTGYGAVPKTNDNRDVLMYYTDSSDLKITTHNDSWFFANNTNRDIKVSLYRWSAFSWSNSNFFPENKSGFGTFSSFDFTVSANQKYYLMTKKDRPDYYRFMLNNFDVDYPENYEGPRFYKELPKLLPDIAPISRYKLRDNILTAGSPVDSRIDLDYWQKMKIDYELFRVDSDDNEVQLDRKLLPTNQDYFFDFNDMLHAKYYLVITYHIGDNIEKRYNFKDFTIELSYKGFSTDISGSTSELTAPFVEKPEFVYEQCDNLDIACHLRNFATKIREIFTGFFVPDQAIFRSDFESFKHTFSDKLGFLAQSVDILLSWLSSFVSAPARCSFSFSGTGGWLLRSGLSFNFCDLQLRFSALFNFLFLTVRGSLVVMISFAFFKKLKGVLAV